MRGLPAFQVPGLRREPRRISPAVRAAHDPLEIDDDVEAVAPVIRSDRRPADGHLSNFDGFRHGPRLLLRVGLAEEQVEMAILAVACRRGGRSEGEEGEERRDGADKARGGAPRR
jgi:hypothetical protein